MTTDIKAWIDERRAIHAAAPGEAWSNYGTPPFEVYDSTKYADGDMGEVLAETRALKVSHAITDAHNMFPRALTALEAVNAQIGRMEADANTYGDGGHDLACDALFAYVMTLRQAIEGEINE